MSLWHKYEAAILRGSLQLLVIVILLVAGAKILATENYTLQEGVLSYKLTPSIDGGVDFSLGPAGKLQLKTHRTPIRLEMGMVLTKDLAKLTDGEILSSGFSSIQPDAVSSLYRFLASKIPWLLLFGAALGILVSGRKRFIRSALVGVAAVFVLAGGLIGLSALTLDRTPEVEYHGLSNNLPKVVRLVRELNGALEKWGGNYQEIIAGLENVSAQLNTVRSDKSNGTTRVLVLSDIHDNYGGLRLASDIISGELGPFSCVVITGDLTNKGFVREAEIIISQLDTAGLPVYCVGGNHENRPAMDTFQEAGYQLLDHHLVSHDNLVIMGRSDPLAYFPEIIYEDREIDIDQSAEELADKWLELPAKPDLLVVHNLRQARKLIELAKEEEHNLTVVFGHNHETSVEQEESVTIIGVGTSGANGFVKIGQNPDTPYTYQILDFSGDPWPKLLSVTTLTFEGLNGKSIAEYTPVN